MRHAFHRAAGLVLSGSAFLAYGPSLARGQSAAIVFAASQAPDGCTAIPKRIVSIAAAANGGFTVLFDDSASPPARFLWHGSLSEGRQVALHSDDAAHLRIGADASAASDGSANAFISSDLKRSEIVPTAGPLGPDDSLWRETASGTTEWLRTGDHPSLPGPSRFITALGQPAYSQTGQPHWVAMLSPSRDDLPTGFAVMSGTQTNLHSLLEPASAGNELQWLSVGRINPSSSGNLLATTVLETGSTSGIASRALVVAVDPSSNAASGVSDVGGPGRTVTTTNGVLSWNFIRSATASDDLCDPAGTVFLTGTADGYGVVSKDGEVVLLEGEDVVDPTGAPLGSMKVAGAAHSLASNSAGDYAAAVPIHTGNAPPKLAAFLNSRAVLYTGLQIEPGRNIVHVYRELALAERGATLETTVLARVLLTVPNSAATEEAVVAWTGVVDALGNCPADYDASGGVDGDDVIAFFTDWDAMAPAADLDCSGGIDGDDVIVFFQHWDIGC